MRRIQFHEFHEQPWFSSALRDEVTDALQTGLGILKAYASIAPMLQNALNAAATNSIVDLCSGGGGPWLELSRTLQGEACVFQIQLTDKYPNLPAFENMRVASGNRIGFHADSLDATNVRHDLNGFRTMFSSFHHFTPKVAAAVLQDAVDAHQGIAVFEATRRAPFAMALMVPWAFMAFLYTPWIRPFRWSRLLWTYVIPLIPFVLLFDGVVSCLRTYQPNELREIIGKLTDAEYQWQVGEHPNGRFRAPITYLIGRPQALR
jgi:hypothetical protein